jgi:hypothetical protein
VGIYGNLVNNVRCSPQGTTISFSICSSSERSEIQRSFAAVNAMGSFISGMRRVSSISDGRDNTTSYLECEIEELRFV